MALGCGLARKALARRDLQGQQGMGPGPRLGEPGGQLPQEDLGKRGADPVEEPDQADRPLLRLAARERERAQALELPPQGVVALLGRLDDLLLQRAELV